MATQDPWERANVGKEFSHQSALFQWVAMARLFGVAIANRPEAYKIEGFARRHFEGHKENPSSYPEPAHLFRPVTEFEWFHAVKNQGHGDVVRGARSAAEGVKPGVFDMFLPEPMSYGNKAPFEGAFSENEYGDKGFHGLYLELKRPGKWKVSEPQIKFQKAMRDAGFAAEVAVGWEAARDVLLTYLQLGR